MIFSKLFFNIAPCTQKKKKGRPSSSHAYPIQSHPIPSHPIKSIRLPITPPIEKALLAIQMEKAPSAAGFSHAAFNPHGSDGDADEQNEGQDRMAGGTAPRLEEGLLQGARGGFGGELGRMHDNFGEGFEDGCSRGDDVSARFGQVPVATILERMVSGDRERTRGGDGERGEIIEIERAGDFCVHPHR